MAQRRGPAVARGDRGSAGSTGRPKGLRVTAARTFLGGRTREIDGMTCDRFAWVLGFLTATACGTESTPGGPGPTGTTAGSTAGTGTSGTNGTASGSTSATTTSSGGGSATSGTGACGTGSGGT